MKKGKICWIAKRQEGGPVCGHSHRSWAAAQRCARSQEAPGFREWAVFKAVYQPDHGWWDVDSSPAEEDGNIEVFIASDGAESRAIRGFAWS